MDREGVPPFVLPGTGGISYNVKVGDPAFGWAGGTILNPVYPQRPPLMNGAAQKNQAYNTLSCVGNEAVVISGDAKGGRGGGSNGNTRGGH